MDNIFLKSSYGLEDYKTSVALVCSYLADLNKVLDESEQGIEPDKELLEETLLKLEEAKSLLVKIKDSLKLGTSLSAFCDDLNLFGAEFIHGRFKIHKGHEESYKRETLTAAKVFIDNFSLEDNPYTFEAMCMALFFCYPLMDTKEEVTKTPAVVISKPTKKKFLRRLFRKEAA